MNQLEQKLGVNHLAGNTTGNQILEKVEGFDLLQVRVKLTKLVEENHITYNFNDFHLTLDRLVKILKFNLGIGAFFDFFLGLSGFVALLLQNLLNAVFEDIEVLLSHGYLLRLLISRLFRHSVEVVEENNAVYEE